MPVTVEHLRRVYGSFAAVDDLSFEVAAGEIVGLIGPNGAGKTTTLRSLAGILRPTSGRIRIDGHQLTGPGCLREVWKTARMVISSVRAR